ncbi:MAG: hypothetical protein COY42_14325 [Armatimonadetes bacterium CG_4_10_14_0_8_um_filter_66_14]|nr:MAG: hypothetical protein COY42_14325 [Armatimonadetes bacterium CG_4_10_14_0_8_um_filter_66_14]PJB61873.1 MAG: hypothetical protein CO096_27155 [Armatimonadetes bacterium CG_4_9_14_3_um_filter_66_14]
MNGVSLRGLAALTAVGIVFATAGTQRAWGSERLTDEQLGHVVGRTTGQYVCGTKLCEEAVEVTCEREEGTTKCWTVWARQVPYCRGVPYGSGSDYCEKVYLTPMNCCTWGGYWTWTPEHGCQCPQDGSGIGGEGGVTTPLGVASHPRPSRPNEAPPQTDKAWGA